MSHVLNHRDFIELRNWGELLTIIICSNSNHYQLLSSHDEVKKLVIIKREMELPLKNK